MIKITNGMEKLTFVNAVLIVQKDFNKLSADDLEFIIKDFQDLQKIIKFKTFKKKYKWHIPNFEKREKKKTKEQVEILINKITDILKKINSKENFNEFDESLRILRKALTNSFYEEKDFYILKNSKDNKTVFSHFNDKGDVRTYSLSEYNPKDKKDPLDFSSLEKDYFEEDIKINIEFLKKIYNSPNHSLKLQGIEYICDFNPNDLKIQEIKYEV